MRVGILTFHFANNYGAVLQAYCLCEAVKRLGHAVRLINYVPPSMRLRLWQGWGAREGKYVVPMTVRRLRFARFRKHHLPLTPEYRTISDLATAAEHFDALIVGSDQVWNGHFCSADRSPYFLECLDNPRCRRISYAACFGEAEQPPDTVAAARRLLPRFDWISVRNDMSANLVRAYAGRSTELAIDPTFLSSYEGVVKPQPKRPDYIAAYYVRPTALELGKVILQEAKKRLQLPIVMLGPDRRDITGSDHIMCSAGPSEWLGVLHGAAYICTDSFHGTAVALKLRKPFLAWEGYRPERLRYFLSTCGLKDRLVGSNKLSSVEDLINTSIDYNFVAEQLSLQVKRSVRFLEQALAS